MAYPYRNPPTERIPPLSPVRRTDIQIRDPFWIGLKVTLGALCAITIWVILGAFFWVVVIAAIVGALQ